MIELFIEAIIPTVIPNSILYLPPRTVLADIKLCERPELDIDHAFLGEAAGGVFGKLVMWFGNLGPGRDCPLGAMLRRARRNNRWRFGWAWRLSCINTNEQVEVFAWPV